MYPSNSLSAQRGASVTGVILLLIMIVVLGKLLVAILPAQIGDYQLTSLLSEELSKANAENLTEKQFIAKVDQQLSINADYDTEAKEILIFTNSKPGQLAIRKEYPVTNNFFGNIDIVNRFEGDIEPTPAK